MEKQRNYKDIRFIIGLLVFLISSFSSLFAQGTSNQITIDQIRKLEINAVENQDFLVEREIKYQLILPGISPLNVFITNPVSEKNIIFKTLRRTGFGNDSNTTKIELWYQYNEPGEYAPAPLKITISSHTFEIPFSKIFISEPLENIRPAVYIKFSNGKTITKPTSNSVFQGTVSKPVKFQILIMNVKEVKSIDYEIPKNSLFTKRNNTSFEWTPMKKGRIKFPEFKVTVTGNNGSQTEIRTPECFITVADNNQKASGTAGKTDLSFAESFTDISVDSQETESTTLNDNFELKLQKHKQTTMKWLFIFITLILLAAIAMYFMKIKSPVPYLILSVLLILVMILFSALSKKHLAVYTEGTVKSIPELNSGKILQIPENTEVKILKDVGGWYCIQNGSVTGWTLKENVRIY